MQYKAVNRSKKLIDLSFECGLLLQPGQSVNVSDMQVEWLGKLESSPEGLSLVPILMEQPASPKKQKAPAKPRGRQKKASAPARAGAKAKDKK